MAQKPVGLNLNSYHVVLQFVVFLAASLEPTLTATQQVVLYQGIKLCELEADK